MLLQLVNLCGILGRVQAGLLEFVLRLRQLVKVKVLSAQQQPTQLNEHKSVA